MECLLYNRTYNKIIMYIFCFGVTPAKEIQVFFAFVVIRVENVVFKQIECREKLILLNKTSTLILNGCVHSPIIFGTGTFRFQNLVEGKHDQPKIHRQA